MTEIRYLELYTRSKTIDQIKIELISFTQNIYTLRTGGFFNKNVNSVLSVTN